MLDRTAYLALDASSLPHRLGGRPELLDRLGPAEAWQVRKPSAEGWVHSVELLDDRGEVISLFFGAGIASRIWNRRQTARSSSSP